MGMAEVDGWTRSIHADPSRIFSLAWYYAFVFTKRREEQMNHRVISVLAIAASALATVVITGCGAAASMGTAAADANQKPPVSSYVSRQPVKAVYLGATRAMSAFGTVLSATESTGTVQGQKGNWVLTATATESKPGTRIDISVRYVPSNKMDLNSREGLTADYVSKLQKDLNETLQAK